MTNNRDPRTERPAEKPVKPVKGALAPQFDVQVVAVLAELRKAAGLSQDEAGRAAGFADSAKPRDAISGWERGMYPPADWRRGEFMLYLWDTLQLHRNPARFCEVWRDVAHGQWHWPALDETLLTEGFPDRIPELLREAVAASTGPAFDEPPLAELLPRVGAYFTGRTDQIRYYTDSLKKKGLAVLTGMAGVGKTSLASALAQQRAPKDKIFWHTFAKGEDIHVVLWQLAGFLHRNGQREVWRMIQAARAQRGPLRGRELSRVLPDGARRPRLRAVLRRLPVGRGGRGA